MTKKKIKYPDGGTLPTYTTGTPEYQAYLAKQKQYEEYKAKHDALLSQGYSNQIAANQAETDRLNKQFGITPSGWYRYNTPETIGETNFNGYIYNTDAGGAGNMGTRYTYAPYYDSPGEATIVKSQTDLEAEKKKAENEALLKQYQGEVHEVVYDPQSGTNKVEKKLIPIGTDITDLTGSGKYFPYTSGTPQYADGGKLGSYIGDTLKLYGDYSLSTIGLSNIVNDDMYKNKGFADASRVAEKFGSYAGQIAGNIIAPGIGGQVVKQTQNVLGNIQPEDTYRQHLNEINSLGEQGQLGKFQNGAYNTSNYVDPALGVTTIAGELGTMFSSNGVEGMKSQVSNLKDTVSNLPIFPFGGNLDRRKEIGFTFRPAKYGNQNYFEYMQNAQREIYEKNPTLLTTQSGDTYVSDYDNLQNSNTEKIGLLESMKRANLINKNTREHGRDFGRVKLNAFVDRTTNEIPTFSCGGKMKYSDGGEFIEYNGADHSNGGIPIDQNGNPTTPQTAQAEVEGGETMHNDGIDKYIFSDRLMQDPKNKVTFADASKKINRKYKDLKDPYQKQARELELNRLKQEQEIFKSTIAGTQNTQQTPMFPDGGSLNFIPYSPEYLNNNEVSLRPIAEQDLEFTLDQPVKGRTYLDDIKNSYKSEVNNNLPQDEISPVGFMASNIGNVYDLFQAAKPLEKNKFDKVNLDTISLESQRRELEKQAGLSRDINRESVRNLATSSGQALGNQIVGNALINSSLGSGLSQSFLNEATTNVGIKNQQELTNNQIRQAEIIADQMDKAKRQSTTSQALHSVGMNTQGYVRDLKSAKVGNENNKLWFDAIKTGKYTQMGFDSEGNAVIQLHDGRVITKPKTN